MAKEELTQEKLDRANEIVMKLAKVFLEEGDKCNSNTLMLFVLSRFTAGILSALQINMGEKDLAGEFMKFVRKDMEDMLKKRRKEANNEKDKEDDIVN